MEARSFIGTEDDESIRRHYREWKIQRMLKEDEYLELVKDAYLQLIEFATRGEIKCYGDLRAFRELKEKGFSGDVLRGLIGAVVGACSECEAKKGHPLISSLARSKDTGEPGPGYFGLSPVPPLLRKQNWEDEGVKPPKSVIEKRLEFWLSEVERVHRHWRKHNR